MAKLINQSNVTASYTMPDQAVIQVNVKSNESSTENMTTSFEKQRTSAKTIVMPLEEIEQTLTLTNTSEYTIFDINIQDTLGEGIKFKTGSVVIDDVSFPDYDPIAGILLDDLDPQSTMVIKYLVVTDENMSATSADIKSKVTYSVNEVLNLEEFSNTVTLYLSNNSVTLNLSADKTVLISGQTIEYKIEIENNGNLKNSQIVLVDNLPPETTFQKGSVKIDGVVFDTFDPSVGFEISDLEPNQKATVTFVVMANWLFD